VTAAETREKLRQAIELVEASTRQVEEHTRETRLSFVRIVTLAFEARMGRPPTDPELRADLERFWPGGGATAMEAQPVASPPASKPPTTPRKPAKGPARAPGAEKLARAHVQAIREAVRQAERVARSLRVEGSPELEDEELAAVRDELRHHVAYAVYRYRMQIVGWLYPQPGFRHQFEEGRWTGAPDEPKLIQSRMRRLPGHLAGEW
jgi:hypothetical protein